MQRIKKLSMILVIILLLISASLIAVYSFGRFAHYAKGDMSYALATQEQQTQLDRALGPQLRAHPNQTSLLLITNNLDAFAMRAMSAREAGRSLDLQYYIWRDDLTGQLLGLELFEAAERGVRIRVILDDLNVNDHNNLLATLNLHPNISIRLFNPTRVRHNSLLRGIEILLRAFSFNRRMHNKAWIADGRLAIVGGRNIGNEYFGAADSRNFFDADLLIGGKAVAEAETIFDEFWNSEAVIPVEALVTIDNSKLAQLKAKIQQQKTTDLADPYLKKLQVTPSVDELFHNKWDQGDWKVHWTTDAHIYSDPAIKAFGEGQSSWLIHRITSVLANTRHSLRLISPYFIPGQAGVAQLTALKQLGVTIDILTNSLAANDVLAAHGGYAPYRKALLTDGINLYELKPFGNTVRGLFGPSAASLHTKALLIDDKIGLVGSFNFDPRSANLNTEMGIIFTEPNIVQALQAEFASKISHDMSYQLFLQDDNLYWLDKSGGEEPYIWQHDPHSQWWQRAIAKVIGFLPIESQL